MSATTKSPVDSGQVPEGGWGWAVTVGMAAMFVVTVGPIASFSLIFGQYLTDLGEGTQSITVITSVWFTAFSLSGLVTNYSLRTYSCRQVGTLGAILFFLGNSVAIFTNGVVHLTISFGIVTGVGMGLMVPASFACFNTYFLAKRKLVMIVANVLAGAGATLYPLATQALVDEFGFRGAHAILTAISLNAVASMVVLRPVPNKAKVTGSSTATGALSKTTGEPGTCNQVEVCCNNAFNSQPHGTKTRVELGEVYTEIEQTETNVEDRRTQSAEFELAVDCTKMIQDTTESLVSNCESGEHDKKYSNNGQYQTKIVVDLFPQTITMNPRASITSVKSWMEKKTVTLYVEHQTVSPPQVNKKTSVWWAIVNFLDLTLLKDPIYVNLTIGVSLVLFADLMFFLLLPIVVHHMGFTQNESAVCLAVAYAGDLVGRVFLVGVTLFAPSLTSRHYFFIGTLSSVILRIIFLQFRSYLAVLIVSGLLGFFRGWILAPMMLVFAEYCTADRFPSAYGLFMVISGILSLLLGPLVGYVRDVTGSYTTCVYSLTCVNALCVISWITEAIVIKLQTLKKHKNIEEGCNAT